MEFGIEKCVRLIMRSRKRQLSEGKQQPNQEKIRALAKKETYKYLGILEAYIIEKMEMKEKNLKSVCGE